MALTRTVVLNRGNYPSGTRQVTARAVADDVVALGLSVARCTAAEPTLWPNASTTVSVALELQVGGVWRDGGSFFAEGGIAPDGDGGDIDAALAIFSIPPGVGRRVRATVVIAGGPLRTEVAVLEVTA